MSAGSESLRPDRVLHNFDGADGLNPYSGILFATNGSFYGTTYQGGPSNLGTVFELSVGVGAFVETLPAVGRVGGSVEILGTNLTGATSVAFNGTPAVFTVDSSSLITSTVPTGATTGKVEVATPMRMLKSNIPFRVLP